MCLLVLGCISMGPTLGLPYPPYYGWESPKIPPVWGVVKNASGGVTPPGDSSPKWVGVRTEWGGVQEESKFSNFKWLLPGMGRSAGGSQNFKFMKTPPRNRGGVMIIDSYHRYHGKLFLDPKSPQKVIQNTRYIPCIFKVLKIIKCLNFFEFKKF